jgi:hypothetical protein
MSNFLVNPFPFKFAPPQGNFGSWREIARETTVGLVETFEVTNLPKKDYYWILFHTPFQDPNGSGLTGIQFNGDIGNNYPNRSSENGGADTLAPSNPQWDVGINQVTGEDEFGSYFIDNTDKKLEHLLQGHTVGSGLITHPSSNAPSRLANVAKWTNPNEEFIDRIRVFNPVSGNFEIGAELVVLGWDRNDTPNIAQNFWEHLGSSVLTTTAFDLTLNFAVKKYLWLQIFENQFGPQPINVNLRVGIGGVEDSGTKYSQRRSINGGADATLTSQTSTGTDISNVQRVIYYNCFIVNPNGREKLAYMIQGTESTNISGGSRYEIAWKFNEETGQINFIRIFRTAASGGLNAGSRIDVWGHD